jgi:hypothetical protein
MTFPIQVVSRCATWKETLARPAFGPNEPGPMSSPAKDLDLAREPKLKPRVALLLFSAVFAGLWGSPVFAQDAKSRLTSEMSSKAAVKSNQAETGVRPEVSPEPKEPGLTQEAPEIARIFGLPITNSMVVTWITAPSLIVFARSLRGT